MDFFGRLHPLLLHLPIGILLYVFLHWAYERLLSRQQRPSDFSFALGLGAISAVASAASGWVLAADGGYDVQLLNWHRYLGLATAIGSIVLWWAYRQGGAQKSFGVFFVAFVLLLSATGHFGGSLTHGEDFLTKAPAKPSTVFLENPQEAHIFNDIIMPIVETKCASCHNPQKSKGELLLHDLDGWLKGGENGPVLKPGSASESPLITRVFLPKEEEEHMPPSGKLQLSHDERQFLKWWVDNMQHYEHQIKDLATNPEVDAYLKSLQQQNEPKVESPTQKQLELLAGKGLMVSRQSGDLPWVDVSLAAAEAFEVENLKYLKRIRQAIKTIDLSRSAVTDTEVEILGTFQYVESINLSHCAISSSSISFLEGLPFLRTLNVYGSQVDSSIFPLLEHLPQLQSIYVWETLIATTQIAKWQTIYPDLEIVAGVDFEQFGSPELVPPTISAEQDLFTDSLLVSFVTNASRGTIKYTIDGSAPVMSSATYSEPFYVNRTSEIKAMSVMEGWTNSQVVSRTFAKSRYPVARIQSSVAPNEKYAAEGLPTLIDLKKGTEAFADGSWLGFYGDDVVLDADLGGLETINGVTISVLSDFTSYIHPPRSIRIDISTDGRSYRSFQKKDLTMVQEPTEAKVHNHYLSANPQEARYLRIRIENQRVNPDWHPTPGAKCWLFIDELLVD